MSLFLIHCPIFISFVSVSCSISSFPIHCPYFIIHISSSLPPFPILCLLFLFNILFPMKYPYFLSTVFVFSILISSSLSPYPIHCLHFLFPVPPPSPILERWDKETEQLQSPFGLNSTPALSALLVCYANTVFVRGGPSMALSSLLY